MGSHKDTSASPDAWAAGGYAPTVVVVSDDADVRDHVALGLHRAGLRAWAYSDDEDATAAIHRLKPHVTVFEWRVPETGGAARCEELRRDPRHARMGIVVISRAAGSAAAAIATAADYHLVNPVRSEKLLPLVRSLAIRAMGLAPRSRPPAAAPPAEDDAREVAPATEARPERPTPLLMRKRRVHAVPARRPGTSAQTV